MQSKRQSLIEVMTGTGLGFLGSLLIVWLCMKLISNQELAALSSTILCTVWSIARNYALRRYFNRKSS